jgi:hypothetical protein
VERTLEQARFALARTADLVRAALSSNPARSSGEVEELAKRPRETAHRGAEGACRDRERGLRQRTRPSGEDLRPRIGPAETYLAATNLPRHGLTCEAMSTPMLDAYKYVNGMKR